MIDIGELALNDTVLIKKGVEAVYEGIHQRRKFPEDVIGSVCHIFLEDDEVSVNVKYDKIVYCLIYRPSHLVKV
jgi:hypothetical protein